MEISYLTIALLIVYVAVAVIDQISIQAGLYTPLFAATFTGFLMGDVAMGLTIGATLQLMTLGVATYGGATIPDYLSGAIMGTAYAIMSGQGAEYGIGLAIPIGLLLTQLDVLGRMANMFVQKKADKAALEGNARGVEQANLLGSLAWILSRVIPVFVGLVFGEAVVTTLNSVIPGWFMNGLRAAGQILPAMGMAILLRYLPVKRYWPYLVIGFVIIAYGAPTFTLLSVALLGLAFAALHLKRTESMSDMGQVTIDDEEVEIDA